MKTTLLFVRHAEAEGNVQRIFHGWYDSDITKKGELQADLIANKLKDFEIDVLYSSSLKRTLRTAKYISNAVNLPIIISEDLKEINGGDWENVPWSDLPKLWPERYNNWENHPHILEMPNGETMVGFQNRLLNEVNRIIKENTGKTICIVTHGTAIKALMCKFAGLPLREMKAVSWCENTALTAIEYENNNFKIILDGDFSHLNSEHQTVHHQEWWKTKLKYGLN